ncbi:MAG: hypothetical protein AAB620_02710 [Patescibacteria group bacterium]
MPLEIAKQGRETTQSLIRRFTTRVRQSGVLKRARSIRFKLKPSSHLAKKKAALRKGELRIKYEMLKKQGKLPEPVRRTYR